MTPSGAGMIAVDWGTTQLRAYRADDEGRILEARAAPKGVLSVAMGAFPATLEAILGDWLDGARQPILMSGMVGSRQGWIEVPYVACPAGVAEIARGVRELEWGEGRKALILPGLSCRDADGVPDVMRGEEAQIIGALAMQPANGIASVWLPGTHSKHSRVGNGVIEGFATYMTGELYALLRAHGILACTMPPEPRGDGDAFDVEAFGTGIACARQAGGLLHHLFGVRTRFLMGEMAEASLPDYLSGLLIGHEIFSARLSGRVLIVGAPALSARYERALDLCGLRARSVPSDEATVKGLALIARAIRKDRS